MMAVAAVAAVSFHLLWFLSLYFFLCAGSSKAMPIKDVDTLNPVSHLIPSLLGEYSSAEGAIDILSCGRVRVSGLSRLKLKSYANSLQVTLTPSLVKPESFYGKIEVCSHRNSSLGLCQCINNWRAIQEGTWSTVMSPYEDRYFDVKFVGGTSGSVAVSVKEEFHQWRVFGLGFGFVLLLVAPSLSKAVPFYHCSSMASGVLLVISMILYQLGFRSFTKVYFYMPINSTFLYFGGDENMHTPVAIFIFFLVAAVLVGTTAGYYFTRKFVIAEDGRVKASLAHCVKWALRTFAANSIFQSTLDSALALLALASCSAICDLITYLNWGGPKSNLKRLFAWSESPTEGMGLLSPNQDQDYYSTFHKTLVRRRFSEKELKAFTRESTRQAMAELLNSMEFNDWIIDNTDRIRLGSEKSSGDNNSSGCNSSGESSQENGRESSLFNWYFTQKRLSFGSTMIARDRICRVLSNTKQED